MTENNEPNTDDWDSLMDTFLKAIHFTTWPGKAFISAAEAGTSPRGKPQLICDARTEKGKFKWDVNVTNMRKLQELGVKAPKDLLNHNVYFNKIRVKNPSTQQMVDSLEVSKVE